VTHRIRIDMFLETLLPVIALVVLSNSRRNKKLICSWRIVEEILRGVKSEVILMQRQQKKPEVTVAPQGKSQGQVGPQENPHVEDTPEGAQAPPEDKPESSNATAKETPEEVLILPSILKKIGSADLTQCNTSLLVDDVELEVIPWDASVAFILGTEEDDGAGVDLSLTSEWERRRDILEDFANLGISSVALEGSGDAYASVAVGGLAGQEAEAPVTSSPIRSCDGRLAEALTPFPHDVSIVPSCVRPRRNLFDAPPPPPPEENDLTVAQLKLSELLAEMKEKEPLTMTDAKEQAL